MPDDRITYRPGPVLNDLEARAGAASVDLIARRDVARYYRLIADELRTITLTDFEASAICDALNGLFMDEHAYRFIAAEVADAIRLDALDTKWGIDGPQLLARLQALTPGQRMAIVDAVERFWLAPEAPTGDGLRAVGLVRD